MPVVRESARARKGNRRGKKKRKEKRRKNLSENSVLRAHVLGGGDVPG
jgi:hypothetical protein